MPSVAGVQEQLLAAVSGLDGADNEDLKQFQLYLKQETDSNSPQGALQVWNYLTKNLLAPQHPFAAHLSVHELAFSKWPKDTLGPSPIWTPDDDTLQGHNVTRFLKHFKGDAEFEARRTGDPCADWPLLQQLSVRAPELFWSELLLHELRLPLHTPPKRLLHLSPHPDDCRWLPGARLNIAHCALTSPKAAEAPGKPAILWADEACPTAIKAVSREQLRAQALHVAACLGHITAPGDPVAIAMPMTPLSVSIYLGIVLSGRVVVSIADSFSAQEVAARLRIAGAKAVFTQDVVLRGGKSLPLYTRMVEAGAPTTVVLPAHGATFPEAVDGISSSSSSNSSCSQTQAHLAVPLSRPCDLPWSSFLSLSDPHTSPAFPVHVARDAYEATNILFSSGTTGEPKAIPWTHITPMRCAADAWAHQNVQPGDVVCWPTNMGWMMGPWLVYASLLNGATMALYNGAPLGSDFLRFVCAARVRVLGLVPSIVKAWRQADAMRGLDFSSLRCFSSTGEASAPDDYHWLVSQARYRAPVIEYCGGTEIGGGFISGSTLQPQAPSTFSTPTLGVQLVLLGQGEQMSPHSVGAPAATGEVALAPPILGTSQRLLNRDHAEVYYSDMPLSPCGPHLPLRRHGDEMQRLPGGYYAALGRCDDTMNLGGIKVSSVELERAVEAKLAGVSEVAAVGVSPPGGGPEQLVLFLVLANGGSAGAPAPDLEQLRQRCQEAIRSQLNPLFKVEGVHLRAALPRTASNKLMRRLLRDELMSARQRPPRSRL